MPLCRSGSDDTLCTLAKPGKTEASRGGYADPWSAEHEWMLEQGLHCSCPDLEQCMGCVLNICCKGKHLDAGALPQALEIRDMAR